jgi:hypothetical protein
VSEQTRIEVGQRWRSRDKRDHGRTVTVQIVDRLTNGGGNGYVTVRYGRSSTMRSTTLRTRYDLVSEATS